MNDATLCITKGLILPESLNIVNITTIFIRNSPSGHGREDETSERSALDKSELQGEGRKVNTGCSGKLELLCRRGRRHAGRQVGI